MIRSQSRVIAWSDRHALLWEARFVVDPGGFEDLARALTTAYTPYHADDALRRLAWLLTERLTGQTAEAFRGWGLAEELGVERYRLAVDRLWERLVWYDFHEVVPPASYRWGGSAYAPGEVRSHRRVVGHSYAIERSRLELFADEWVLLRSRAPGFAFS